MKTLASIYRLGCICGILFASPWATIHAQPAPAKAPFSIEEAQTTQKVWADFLKKPVRLTNSLGMVFALIPPGQFVMGSPPDEAGRTEEETTHRVTLTHAFYLGQAEVTQKQWQSIMGDNPSFFTGDDLPVDTVTWEQAAAFCRKLSEQEGANYRLPTEAEWEYTCRAGTQTPFHTGVTIHTSQANYNGEFTYGDGRKGEFRETTTSADQSTPNAWGLHDMHGNVWEWCQDWHGAYSQDDTKDPTGPESGKYRVVRGGCWINFPAVCRSANRGKIKPVSWNFHTGFRVARGLD